MRRQLLPVAFDRVRVANLRLVGVLPELRARPALAEQVPAAVQLDLHIAQPLAIFIELLALGAVGLLAATKLMLLRHEVLDARGDTLVAHPPHRSARALVVAAIVFDLDGVLLDSEGVWNAARKRVAQEHGGRWPADAQRKMMGMSSTEWSAYMHDELGVSVSPEEISAAVVSRLEELYREHLPLLPGARKTVTTFADIWTLALASSANRPIIDLVLGLAGLTKCFAATVSSEEVAHGKPAPDVYLEAARRIGVAPSASVAVEDSANGIRSGAAAGMAVIAVPNREFPPGQDALALADDVVDSLPELTPDRVRRLESKAH